MSETSCKESVLSPVSDNISSEKSEEIFWKEKCEVTEEKLRKLRLLSQKVISDYEGLEKRYQGSVKQYEVLKNKLEQKEELVQKFEEGVEQAWKEHETLKNQLDIQTEASNEVIKRASKWYRENRSLKRKSTLLMQKMMNVGTLDIQEMASLDTTSAVGAVEEDDEDTALLKLNINKLTEEVASLRTELTTAKMKELDLTQEIQSLTRKYEHEKQAHHETSEDLKSLQSTFDQFKKVSVLAVEEFESMKQCYQQESEKARIADSLAKKTQRERNALARQSAVLLNENLDNKKLMKAMDEIVKLNQELEKERQNNEDMHNNLRKEIREEVEGELTSPWKERLKILQHCVEKAEQRTYTAEREIEILQHRVQELECQLQRREAGIPPPLPPPPPPPPPQGFSPLKSLMSLIGSGKKSTPKLPVPKKEKMNPQQNAMLEMIECIKKGNIQLKPTQKLRNDSKSSAMDEMFSLVGKLKKNPTPENSRSQSPDSVDGELFRAFEQRRHKSPSPEKIMSTMGKTLNMVEGELDSVFKKKGLNTDDNETGFGNSERARISDSGEFINDVVKVLTFIRPVVVSPSMSGNFALPYLVKHSMDMGGYVPVAPGATSILERQPCGNGQSKEMSLDSVCESLKDYCSLPPHDLSCLKTPTLVVFGEYDREKNSVLLCLLPRSQGVEIPRGNHPAYLTSPGL